MELRYDFHIHSCLSPCGDNEMTPNNIVGMAKVLELDVIAVSDHNTALNLPAVCKLGEENGVLVVPGIEITTAEEIHVLSLFPDLNSALKISNELYSFLPDIKNDAEIFGEQLILDENDEVVGTIDKLLSNATSLSIDDVFKKVRSYGGVPIPAHIDKSSYSLLSNLGFVPPELILTSIEIKNPPHPLGESYKFITDSDAHSLEVMSEHDAQKINVKEKNIACILDYLRE